MGIDGVEPVNETTNVRQYSVLLLALKRGRCFNMSQASSQRVSPFVMGNVLTQDTNGDPHVFPNIKTHTNKHKKYPLWQCTRRPL